MGIREDGYVYAFDGRGTPSPREEHGERLYTEKLNINVRDMAISKGRIQ